MAHLFLNLKNPIRLNMRTALSEAFPYDDFRAKHCFKTTQLVDCLFLTNRNCYYANT